MPKLYALLVGINQYHPDSNIDNLYGCVNDVKTMDSFLRDQFSDVLPAPDQQVKILLNEKATRAQLIKTFSEHLGKAKENDYILFYYSGHGSYEPTSEEFQKLDGNPKNETLVCYDSRLPGHYDLADKELAVLIHELPAKAQKIIILDSCHSGSATRSMEEVDFGRRRQAPAKRQANLSGIMRPLSTYLLSENNHYVQQVKSGQPPRVPESDHLLLSACNNDETALETTSGRGLFSYHLLKTLTDYKTKISYKDLFVQIRAAIQQSRAGQTPQLEPIGYFNPQYRFLRQISIEEKKYLVKWVEHSFDKSRSHWSLELGAVQGLPTDAQEINDIKLRVYPASGDNADGSPVEVSLSSVGINNSALNFPDGDTSINYLAEITNLPLGMSLWIYLKGSDEEKKMFNKYYEKFTSAYLQFIDRPDGCRYELDLQKQQLFLFHRASGKFIIGAKEIEEWSVKEMVKNLHKIEQWERIKRIEKKADHIPSDKVVFKCEELDTNNQVIHQAVDDQITLTLEQNNGQWKSSKLSIQASNHTGQKLFFLVLYMSRTFQILALKNTDLPPGREDISLFLHELTISDPKLIQVVDVIKVIVSTMQLSPENFVQEKMEVGSIFEKTRFGGKAVPDRKAAPKSDWFTRTFTVTISGNLKNIGPQPVQVAGLSFGSHPQFSAQLSFAPIQAYNLDKNIINQLSIVLHKSSFEIINFSADRQFEDRSVIILNDVKNEKSLDNAPLEITLPPLEDDHTYVPLAYDGELLLPFGEISNSNPPKLSCTSLPVKAFAQRKNQSPTLQFCLLKTALNTKKKITGLHWFDYTKGQKDRRTSNQVKEKIASANKILLLIPGLYNDSVEMGNALQFAHENKSVDLILTFDYDPLNQSISGAAQQLKEMLENNSLAAGHKKTLQILGYSVGCLIARYWLEILDQGKHWAQKALLIAPPNSGLKSTNLKAEFQRAFAFAFNFKPAYVLPLLAKIRGLKPETLSELYADSTLIQQLANASAPTTSYQLITGDLSEFPDNTEQETMQKLLTELDQMVGSIVKEEQKGDGVISIDNAFNISFVSTAQQSTVSCLHYHYFEDGTTLAKVAAWIKEK